ncbi:MAG: glycine zipper 2TM domain-containing protein [Burkholderiales bacterium]|nr:MAG: glycine zipper 2TM domain-containing protein [Burkholderiales bacterium]
MNATLASPALAQSVSAASSTKPLWAAVGVLSVCVLAMGATLVNVNKRPEPLAQASIPLSSAMAMNAPAALTAPGGMITEDKAVEKPAVAGTKPAQAAPKVVAKPIAAPVAKAPAPVVVAQAPNSSPEVASGYPPVVSSTPAPVVVAQAPAKPSCTNCGTVEAVTPITREGQGSGVGVVAGGVLGGVVGNQVGKGNGRAAATVLGAIGGGWAGNAIEKNMKKTTAYSVRVRMEDGSSRTVEQSSAPMVGSKVTLDGSTIRPA